MPTLTKLIASLFLALTLATGSAYAAKIDINKATASELMQLDGIGEKKAQAIVKFRKKHGKFTSAQDLLNVPGIGEATVKKNAKTLGFKASSIKTSTKKKATTKKAKATKSTKSTKDKAKKKVTKKKTTEK